MSEAPPPLTPEDCELQDFAFMPLDVARLRDSDLASDESPEACWAAVLLWAASWHQIPAASMPDNEAWIAKHAGYAQRGKISEDWAAVRYLPLWPRAGEPVRRLVLVPVPAAGR